jgi:hypothetical protein
MKLKNLMNVLTTVQNSKIVGGCEWGGRKIRHSRRHVLRGVFTAAKFHYAYLKRTIDVLS